MRMHAAVYKSLYLPLGSSTFRGKAQKYGENQWAWCILYADLDHSGYWIARQIVNSTDRG